MENLAVIDTVVFDKTGTLTRDALTLHQIQVRAGVSPDQALAMAAALGQYSLHPVSRALVSQLGIATKSITLPLWHATDVQETPGQGVEGRLTCSDGGAAARVRLGSARFCKVQAVRGPYLHTCLADDQGWLATFEFEEDIRPDAIATVAELKAAGLDIHLLSGDDGPAVQAVASAVGIQKALGACSPQEKLDYLHRLQERGRFVAMVGDGLNDGPVLAGAHVSFAFGSAAPLARAHADIVVLGDQLLPVLQALRQAKQTRHIVKQNLWWAALYNLTCVPLAVMGWLPAWLAGLGMGLSSLFVVVNALRLSQLPPVPEV